MLLGICNYLEDTMGKCLKLEWGSVLILRTLEISMQID